MTAETRATTNDAVIGVDVGGTKTRLLLAPVVGDTTKTLRDVVVPTASWCDELGDTRRVAVSLHGLIVDRLGPSMRDVTLVVGAHGCENTAHCRAFERELAALWNGPVTVVNDAELIPPAMGAGDAIGIVVGTGSIAVARDRDGEMVAAGGWGWLLGDDGSAPALVRDAIRAVLSELDRGESGRACADPLVPLLLHAFDADDAAGLALAATRRASAPEWGEHAPLVFAAAESGSPAARRVISRAATALAGLVETLRERGISADRVVAGGAVIQTQPRLQQALRDELSHRCPDIRLDILDREPAWGAVALARRRCDAGRRTRSGNGAQDIQRDRRRTETQS